MTTTKRKAPKSLTSGRDPVSQLYRAVQRYVEANGGRLLVVGGVQMQEWPRDLSGKFIIAVKCMGKKPVFQKDSERAKGGGD